MRAAIYARISQDREGAGLGVRRQRDDCEALCRERGWTVVAILEDNDVSAYSNRPRPGYRSLLELIAAEDIDVVVAWHGDRLHRRPIELEDYIGLSEKHRVTTHTVMAGPLDLTSASGQMIARVVGAMSRYESQHKGDRVRRAREQAASAGRAHGALGYGYRRNPDTSAWEIVEDEAAVIREAAHRLLAGETLGGICRDLNTRGVPTPKAGLGWRSSNLRQVLPAGKYCGWREYSPGTGGSRGRGRGFGPLVAEGDWPPILTREETDNIRVLLSDPGRRTSRVRTYLLSGILRCSKCGAPMTGAFDKRTGKHRYSCNAQPGLARCGKTVITGPRTDEHVVGMALAALSDVPRQRRQKSAPAQDDQLAIDLAEVNAELQDYMRQKVEKTITVEEWSTAREVLIQRRASLEQRMRETARTVSRRLLPGPPADLKATWPGLDDSRKHAILTALIEAVDVLPPTRSGGNVFDPGRLQVRWLH